MENVQLTVYSLCIPDAQEGPRTQWEAHLVIGSQTVIDLGLPLHLEVLSCPPFATQTASGTGTNVSDEDGQILTLSGPQSPHL